MQKPGFLKKTKFVFLSSFWLDFWYQDVETMTFEEIMFFCQLFFSFFLGVTKRSGNYRGSFSGKVRFWRFLSSFVISGCQFFLEPCYVLCWALFVHTWHTSLPFSAPVTPPAPVPRCLFSRMLRETGVVFVCPPLFWFCCFSCCSVPFSWWHRTALIDAGPQNGRLVFSLYYALFSTCTGLLRM